MLVPGARADRAMVLSLGDNCQPTWDTNTKQFTKQYYKWLEDIGRYEAENGANTITDHVKIATIVNNIKGPTCYTCGQKGHISPNCPTKKGNAKGSQSKGQWYDGKGSWQPQPQSSILPTGLQWLQWTAIEHWSAKQCQRQGLWQTTSVEQFWKGQEGSGRQHRLPDNGAARSECLQ
eukprot:4525739-Amphidinium_carterae.1